MMKKIVNLAIVLTALLTPVFLTSTMAAAEQIKQHNMIDTESEYDAITYITVTLSVLTDNTGLTYVAAKVDDASVARYLAKMSDILGDKFAQYRLGQQQRDHNQFHITLVNPFEYQELSQDSIEWLKQSPELHVKLLGLGRASNNESTTYFVVAHSQPAQMLRDALGLNRKDFHVTLGFESGDVFGVSKGIETLIK